MTEPTATQLYNAVKERRAAKGHRVLTIPEIGAVLDARAEVVDEARPNDEWAAVIVGLSNLYDARNDGHEARQEFLAAATQEMPFLLAEVERLRAVEQAAREWALARSTAIVVWEHGGDGPAADAVEEGWADRLIVLVTPSDAPDGS